MTSKYRVVDKKVFITLRVIVRFSDEGYVAEAIDAGAIGIGDSQDQAIRELSLSLEELWKASGTGMKIKASEEDEKVFKLLTEHKQTGDSSIISFAHIQRIEVTYSSQPTVKTQSNVKTQAVFELAELQPAA